jgi:hypothetical protein
VLFELGNCFQELDDLDRALAYYYACLSDHPNPTLVQRKIKRVRVRLHHIRPATDIHLPDYVQRRIAVAQHGDKKADPAAAIPAPRPKRAQLDDAQAAALEEPEAPPPARAKKAPAAPDDGSPPSAAPEPDAEPPPP